MGKITIGKRQGKMTITAKNGVTVNAKTTRRRRGRISRGIQAVPGYMPPYKNVTLKWATKAALLPASVTAFGTQTFNLTSLKTPDFTGNYSTESPLSWSQFVMNYTRAVVTKVTVKAIIFQNAFNMVYALGHNFNSALALGFDDIHNLCEDKRFVSKNVMPTDTKISILKKTYYPAKYKGLSLKDYIGDDIHQMQYGAYTQTTVTTDPVVCTEVVPTSNQYALFCWQNADEVTSSTARVKFEISYSVRFFRPRDVYSS